MPLYPNAERLIRGNLAVIKRGKKPAPIKIGKLTDAQLAAINADRSNHGLKPVIAEIVFVGEHLYASRIRRDGYTDDDVLKQIASALAEESEFVITRTMTVLQNPALRGDGYHGRVHDQAVFECSIKHPRPMLYSVIPKGDKTPLKKE